MASLGHVLIGTDGIFLNVDVAFGSIMRSSPQVFVGRAVNDVTAPADRDECAVAIAQLRRTHQPFTISKRFLRDDGSLVWVTNSVSITVGTAPIIMATVQPIEQLPRSRSPGVLLEMARFLTLSRSERATVCDRDLMSEPVWDMMVTAYVAEAEGGALCLETMAARSGLSIVAAGRWLSVLLDRDILELELSQDRHASKAFRLTNSALQRFERYLGSIGGKHDETMLLAG